jgi:alanyl-tRNA synthetase
VGDFSTELCGGTHVNNAGEIHLFKIGNESGIAAGVRRIFAYTSRGAFDYLKNKETEVKQIRDRLKVSSSAEILTKIDKITESERT